jgi:nitrite reductase/ring-hydroxylating ferredoxin subunit
MKLSKYLLIFLIFSIAFSQKYDPKTGELIEEQKYDPTTGELIKITKYDPLTGEPIEDIPASKPINTNNVKSFETKINNSLNSPSYLSIINSAKEEASQKKIKKMLEQM